MVTVLFLIVRWRGLPGRLRCDDEESPARRSGLYRARGPTAPPLRPSGATLALFSVTTLEWRMGDLSPSWSLGASFGHGGGPHGRSCFRCSLSRERSSPTYVLLTGESTVPPLGMAVPAGGWCSASDEVRVGAHQPALCGGGMPPKVARGELENLGNCGVP